MIGHSQYRYTISYPEILKNRRLLHGFFFHFCTPKYAFGANVTQWVPRSRALTSQIYVSLLNWYICAELIFLLALFLSNVPEPERFSISSHLQFLWINFSSLLLNLSFLLLYILHWGLKNMSVTRVIERYSITCILKIMLIAPWLRVL